MAAARRRDELISTDAIRPKKRPKNAETRVSTRNIVWSLALRPLTVLSTIQKCYEAPEGNAEEGDVDPAFDSHEGGQFLVGHSMHPEVSWQFFDRGGAWERAGLDVVGHFVDGHGGSGLWRGRNLAFPQIGNAQLVYVQQNCIAAVSAHHRECWIGRARSGSQWTGRRECSSQEDAP
jgi:hypothetical protein